MHVHQVVDQPEIRLNVDRVKASQLGLTQRDVTSSMLISLSGSGTVAPNYWVNWANGVNYNVGVQTPQYRIDSLDALLRTPISVATNAVNSTTPARRQAPPAANRFRRRVAQRLLAGLRKSRRDGRQHAAALELVTRAARLHARDRQPLQRLAGVRRLRQCGPARSGRRRRGSARRSCARKKPHLPRGTSFDLRGQIETMQSSFFRLGLGMIFAVVLVYLLMTVNFQSWLDPFIILTALPGAMAGILWMLFVTGTTLSVPSLMGAIMCIGVATANSILMVTFANDERAIVPSAREAMLSAGYARIRPVLMTATAMILGMLPMALGLGEGGEQNAPLGRAVIGGLLFATVTTLFVVPIIYSYLRTKPPVDHERQLGRTGARQRSLDSRLEPDAIYRTQSA